MGNNPSRANGGGITSRSRSYSQDRGYANAKRAYTTRGKRSKYGQEYLDEEEEARDADEYGRHPYGAFPGQMPHMPQMPQMPQMSQMSQTPQMPQMAYQNYVNTTPQYMSGNQHLAFPQPQMQQGLNPVVPG
ncbi:hypothetical protein C8T65DRAFT_670015 [Cerioporus squamosus]|nr:hypothetical protein C8T65DRAFT_670015 [Cerioporus squamosus]